MSSSAGGVLQIPTIETERLRLRGHTLDDFAASAAMWADENVTQHITGRPQSGEESWSRLLRYAGHWQLLGFGYWVIEEKATGEFIGELGFADYRREIDPPFEGAPEIGWVLATRAHGKGFATEAVRAAVQWGERHFNRQRMVCIIAPENLASIRVAEKAGFRERWRTTYHGGKALIFERPASA